MLPPLATALFIAFFGTNVPFWDEWDLGPLLEKLARHQATLADFFQPQQEHRFFLPKLILAPLALATHWNVIVELWLSFAVALAGYAGLLLLVRRGGNGRLILTSLAYFSLAAYENWLWGWQLSWFLADTLFIWAVVAAGSIKHRPLQIASAALLCVLATFSTAFGVASWIALLPLLWLPARDDERRASRATVIVIWAALFAASLAVYLHQFHPDLGGFPCESFACWAGYLLTIIGSPLSRTSGVAIAAGVVMLSTFAFAAIRAWQMQDRQAAQWTAIGLFAIGFTAINAIGRSGMGLDQALSSRYLTPSSLLLIAVINLDSYPIRFRRPVLIVVTTALIAQSLTVIPIGWHIKQGRDEARVCVDLLLVNDSPDCLPGIARSGAILSGSAIAAHRAGLRPLVTESDFVRTAGAHGWIDSLSRLSATRHPGFIVRGRVDLPSRGLYAIAATLPGRRRIVAVQVIRGEAARWSLLLPPNLVQRSSAFELWLFDPAAGKVRPLPGRITVPH